MTPEEMGRRILQNIDETRAALDDGPCGFVLHTADYAAFVCQRGDTFWLASPRDGDGNIVVIRAYRNARARMSQWNAILPDGAGRVSVSLRREALQGYIDWQQAMLDALIEMESRRQRKEQLNA